MKHSTGFAEARVTRADEKPPEARLWQAVVYQALRDATSASCQKDMGREQRRADIWLRRGCDDFRAVCALAGLDPDFVRDAYISGKIDAERLRASEFAVREREKDRKRRAAE